jgi:outer membrane protein OmpA-like peptidoglycan-associated protein
MKKIIAATLALCFFTSAGFGQSDEIRPAAIGVSFFMNDFKTPDRIRTTSLSAVLRDKQWAKPSEMSPGLAISYFKGLHRHIDFATTLGASFVKYPLEKHTFSNEKLLLELDAAMNFKMVSERFWVQPYAILGVGAHMYGGKYFGAYIPTGLGLKVNFYDDAHFFATTQYKIPVLKEYTNYHLMYQVGIAGRVGKKAEPKIIPPPPPPPPPPPVDTDKDGINDDIDKCPTVPGLPKYEGCPIPDTDKDGINDEEDKCPNVPGLARYQGCPVPDTDKDGINDEDDKCPTEAGPASNQGCPVSEEVIKKVNYAAENILFATNKYVLLSKSFKGLDEVAQILNDDPQLKISIEGHTDNVGKDAFNQKLSENRANAVKNYLVKKGVDASRITVTGFGETVPVADNKTAAGRKQNRRVEMKLSY